MCVLNGVCLREVYAQLSVCGVCVVSGVHLCGVCTFVCAVGGVCLCEVSALCSVCGKWYDYVWCPHRGLCVC